MKTTIEIDTEDKYEIKGLVDIISGYLHKKKISFTCIGMNDKFSIVTSNELRNKNE